MNVSSRTRMSGVEERNEDGKQTWFGGRRKEDDERREKRGTWKGTGNISNFPLGNKVRRKEGAKVDLPDGCLTYMLQTHKQLISNFPCAQSRPRTNLDNMSASIFNELDHGKRGEGTSVPGKFIMVNNVGTIVCSTARIRPTVPVPSHEHHP